MAAPVFKFPTKSTSPLAKDKASEKLTPGKSSGGFTSFDESEGGGSSLNVLKNKSHDDGEAIWLLSYSDLMTLLFGFFVMLMSFSKIDVDIYEKARKETTKLFGGEYQKPMQKLEDTLKEQFKLQGMTDKALFNELESGISLTFRGSVFFDPASADIKPEAKNLILSVIPSIKKQQKKFFVVVEGHTDDNPISNDRFPSNWELSSQRASAVLRLFEENGFPKQNLRAIGFADTLPIMPNRDPQGKIITENQNQNRRVVIKLINAPQ